LTRLALSEAEGKESKMQKRRWDAKTKTRIVLEGLKGGPVSELCNEHQIGQAQYYQWQKQGL
jgi:transposase-like protein